MLLKIFTLARLSEKFGFVQHLKLVLWLEICLFSLEGVFFDNRVEHVKFVDFCGKYRIPLLQYLCSSKCIEDDSNSHIDESGACGYANSNMMKKVLLG